MIEFLFSYTMFVFIINFHGYQRNFSSTNANYVYCVLVLD